MLGVCNSQDVVHISFLPAQILTLEFVVLSTLGDSMYLYLDKL